LASTEETKPNTAKANIHLEHKDTTKQNKAIVDTLRPRRALPSLPSRR